MGGKCKLTNNKLQQLNCFCFKETMKQLLGQFSPVNADEMVRRLKTLAHTFQVTTCSWLCPLYYSSLCSCPSLLLATVTLCCRR